MHLQKHIILPVDICLYIAKRKKNETNEIRNEKLKVLILFLCRFVSDKLMKTRNDLE